MSKLEVDKVTPQSGTTLTIGEAGDTTVINGLGTLPATIGSATQVLAVNAGATGLEYGTAATDLSNLNATNLTSGTVPDGRFPSVLPAAGAQNLTSLQPAAIVGGTFGSINAANLTNLNATALTSGTIPAARISSLPAGVGGKILQVVSSTNSYQKSTTSTSFVDVESSSGVVWETAITPLATSSKILILGSLPLNITGSGNQDNRAYSNVSGKVGAGSYTPLVNYQRNGTYMYSGAASTSAVVPFNYLWTSNTTSECKIKFQFSSYASTSATVYVPALSSQLIVVTLMEIGA